MNELGFNPDAIERQLSHRDPNEIRGTYNLAQYLDERRRMMQAWANYLDGLRTGANVVAIGRKAGQPDASEHPASSLVITQGKP